MPNEADNLGSNPVTFTYRKPASTYASSSNFYIETLLLLFSQIYDVINFYQSVFIDDGRWPVGFHDAQRDALSLAILIDVRSRRDPTASRSVRRGARRPQSDNVRIDEKERDVVLCCDRGEVRGKCQHFVAQARLRVL